MNWLSIVFLIKFSLYFFLKHCLQFHYQNWILKHHKNRLLKNHSLTNFWQLEYCLLLLIQYHFKFFINLLKSLNQLIIPIIFIIVHWFKELFIIIHSLGEWEEGFLLLQEIIQYSNSAIFVASAFWDSRFTNPDLLIPRDSQKLTHKSKDSQRLKHKI